MQGRGYSRNGTSVDIQLGRVESKDLLVSLGDGREGLVELKLGDVLDRETGLLEGEGDGLGGGNGEVDGCAGSIGVGYTRVSDEEGREKGERYEQMMRARGVSPYSVTFCWEARMRAEAPSLRLEALAAVTVPVLLKTGRRPATLSTLIFLYSSSSVTTVLPLRASTIVTGAISAVKAPADQAAAARR